MSIAEQAKYLIDEGQPDEALVLLNEALNENPNDPLSLFLVGYVMLQADRLGLAYNICKRVVELAPHRSEAWNNLGRCLQRRDNIDEAMGYFTEAARLEPDNPAALNNMAVLWLNKAEPKKAIEYARKALALAPDDKGATDTLSLGLLCLRQWAEGWDAYEASLGKTRKEIIYGDEPRWDGVPGKSIVFYGEQGLGDELLYSSCLQEAIDDCEEAIIDCDPRLTGLFKRSFPKATVYGTRWDESPIWADHHIDARCSLGTLPKFYRRSEDKFPGAAYLKADPERRIQWRALFDSLGPEPKIGIAWNGGRKGIDAEFRSIPLKDWGPVLKKDAHFISLEYRDCSEEIEGTKVRQFKHGTLTNDYDDTMAMIAELDHVITVTTTVVHAAGALGVPCTCLVPDTPNWRFHLEGETPWHDSVKLVRQEKGRPWPLHRVKL